MTVCKKAAYAAFLLLIFNYLFTNSVVFIMKIINFYLNHIIYNNILL